MAEGPVVDPAARSPQAAMALAQEVSRLLIKARQSGSLAAVTSRLYDRAEATQRLLSHIPVACTKGCAPCCHNWVSATAPEILALARIVSTRGEASREKVRAAYKATGGIPPEERGANPTPCSLLEDNACSVYKVRPLMCRLTMSADAAICARAFLGKSEEVIPAPLLYLVGKKMYVLAIGSALRQAGLPYRSYELNAGLACAVDLPDAEARWLSGEDIFAGVQTDPDDLFTHQEAQDFYRRAFLS